MVESLTRNFDRRWLALPGTKHQALMEALVRSDLAGGAVYDALIASTAAAFDEPLLTLDRRALRTYEVMGATIRLLS